MRARLPPAVKQFQSAEECMDQKGLEAVLIATETSTHADLAKKAMERGLVRSRLLPLSIPPVPCPTLSTQWSPLTPS